MSIQLKTLSGQHPRLITLDAANARADNPLRIQARDAKVLQLIDSSSGLGPQQLWAKRQGKNLLVSVATDDGEVMQVLIEDYFLAPPDVVGLDADGNLQGYLIAESAQPLDSLGTLSDAAPSGLAGNSGGDRGDFGASTSELFESSWFLPGLTALALGGAAVLIHKSDDGNHGGSSDTTAPSAPELQALADTDPSDGLDLQISLPADAVAGDRLTLLVTLPDGSTTRLTATLSGSDINAGSVTQTIPASALSGSGEYTVTTTLTDTAGNVSTADSMSFTLVSGTVSDDYLAGTTVFVDANGNGQLDAGEVSTTTNANGEFSFAYVPSGAVILAVGGTDSATGLANSLTFKAYEGLGVNLVITPLSSLIAELAEASGAVTASSLQSAASSLNQALGLGLANSSDLLTVDPVAANAAGSESGAILLAASRELAIVMAALQSLGSAAGDSSFDASAFLAEQLASSTISLESASDLNSLLSAAAAEIDGLNASGTALAALADSLAAVNGTIQNATLSGDAAGAVSAMQAGQNQVVGEISVSNGELQIIDTLDLTAPSLSISAGQSTTATGALTYTFTFSEAVSGFSAGDVSVSNGSKGVFTQLSDTVYTLVVTPTANSSGTLTVSVAAGAASDAAGNASTAANASLAFDTSAPALAISHNQAATAAGEVTYTFTFSEAVSSFSADDVSVSNGSKGVFTQLSATVYTLVVTPTANSSGTLTVSVAAGAVSDAAGNASIAASNNLEFDTSAPQLSISDNQDGVANGPVLFTFSFSEAVSNFSIDDIDVSGGNKSSFTRVSDSLYTLLVIPASGASGSLQVSVAAGAASDAAGNPSSAASASQEYDTTAPDTTPPILAITDDVAGTAGGEIVFTFTFSEPVTGFDADDISLSAGTKGSFTQVNGTTYTLVVTPPAASSGMLTVSVAAGAATDAAGNGSTAASGEQVYDTQQIELLVDSTSNVSASGKVRFALWGDYDGDGLLDLFVGVSEGASKLYHNNGDGTFTDVTSSTIGSVNLKMGGATWIDHDGDGDLDLFIAGEETTSLLLQNNSGVFTNIATTAGVASSAKVKAMEAVDYDGDGDVDLFLAVEGGANLLYRNNGDGTFTNVAASAGVAGSSGKNKAAAWGDFDGDGDLDLFVGVSEGVSVLYQNNGDGTFTNVTASSGISTGGMKLSSAVWGDYDGDGNLDLFVPGESTSSRLFHNNGDGTFTEVAATAGVAGLSSDKAKGAAWVDFNGDGKLDLLVIGDSVTYLYQNKGDGTFANLGAVDGVVTTKGRAVSVADYDGDGDLDLALTDENGGITLFQNQLIVSAPTLTITDDIAGTANGVVTFTFTFSSAVTGFNADDISVAGGSKGNFTQVGSQVYTLTVTPDADSSGTLTVTVADGAAADARGQASIGASASQPYDTLNPDTEAPSLAINSDTAGTAHGEVVYTFTFSEPVSGFSADDVTVSGGSKGSFTQLSDSLYTLVVTPATRSTGTLLVSVAAAAASDAAGNGSLPASVEQGFDTTLISLSNANAAAGVSGSEGVKARYAEWADYDGDGQLDLFVAVENGSNALYRNNGDGTFTDVTAASGIAATSSKVKGVVWLDIDGDGDLDLFVAGENSATTLYLNHGDGTFTDIAGAAGVSAAGKFTAAVAADYDGDGDLDIFLPMENGANVLYQNNGDGTFTNVAAAAGVAGNSGKNKAAAWGDFDGDGLLDLFVAVESGTSMLYRNNGDGTFTDVAASAGVAATSGKARSALWADFNADGLLDLFVASESAASALYRNNGDGTFTNVAEAAGVAGLASDKIKASIFADFNNDGWMDLLVLGENVSSLYQNNGDGTFTDIASLSGLGASAKPANVSVADFDGDGDLDIVIADESNGLLLYENHLSLTLSGTGADDTLTGANGNDVLTGHGGADRFDGGRGDDTLVLNASNVSALADAGSNAAVNGGAGLDTLALSGAGIALNLDAILALDNGSRISAVEHFDLTGDGDNSLSLSVSAVLALGAQALVATTVTDDDDAYQLLISGDAGDSVHLADYADWSLSGETVGYNGQTYQVWNHDSLQAQLLIDSELTVA